VISRIKTILLQNSFKLQHNLAIDRDTFPAYEAFCKSVKDDDANNDEDEALKAHWAAFQQSLEVLTCAVLKTKLTDQGLAVGGRKSELIDRVFEKAKLEEKKRQQQISLRKLSNPELISLQSAPKGLFEIQQRRQDLIEYHSHLARYLAKDIWAQKERENLVDDEAIVTSDYKMKILHCFHCENQKKWFGKRGTTLLGFMIVTNATNAA
jgi:hypothetical protein